MNGCFGYTDASHRGGATGEITESPVYLFSKFVGGYFLLLDSEMRHEAGQDGCANSIAGFVIVLTPIRVELGS